MFFFCRTLKFIYLSDKLPSIGLNFEVILSNFLFVIFIQRDRCLFRVLRVHGRKELSTPVCTQVRYYKKFIYFFNFGSFLLLCV